ncbi:MAG: putative transporter [Prevotella sp.]|nr:putative transporter [Prevotella sp.]
MDWLSTLFLTHSAIQTVVVVSLIVALGMALGKLRVGNVSLGIAFVFFTGIVAGHFGLTIDGDILSYTETLGLVLFVYTLGLSVGPTFFSSLRNEGLALNLWSLGVVALGTLMALLLYKPLGIPLSDMVGLLCGATTNTPALGAAQQALEHLGLPSGRAALATAVTYPMGVLGVILAIMLMRRLFVTEDDLKPRSSDEDNHTSVVQFVVVNPALDGKQVAAVSQMTHMHFIISRIWRNRRVIIPVATTTLRRGDNVLVVTNKEEADAMEILFGQRVEKDWNRDRIDWNHIDSKVESRVLVLSRRVLNGKRLGQLQLRNTYGVNVSRVHRGDITLLATDDLRLQYGDRVTVVGEPSHLDEVERFFGNSVQLLSEPNIGSIFLGMIVGLIVGTVPISLPGIHSPIRLGIAGGPIVVGILVGALGPRLHFISYTTRSASLMLRKLGLALYLACLGLDAGHDFFQTVVRPEGLMWVGVGFVLTVVPVLLVGWIALRTKRMDFATICGMLCGSMANPMALTYASDTIDGHRPSVSYASVYPLGMFVRVVVAQVIIMFFL